MHVYLRENCCSLMVEPYMVNPTALTIPRFQVTFSWRKPTYSMMIKLIEGSLTKMDHWRSLFNKDAKMYDDDSRGISTVASIAAKVAWEDSTTLDLKQIITYESICSKFLLQLVNDGEDHSTYIVRYFANAAPSNSSMYPTDSKHNLSCASSSDSTSSNLRYDSDEASFRFTYWSDTNYF